MNPRTPFAPPELLEPAQRIIQRLRQAGYDAYIAGGAVRDWLLNRPQGDIDIATSAPPPAVRRLFPHTVAVGESFGVLIVRLKGRSYEVATFRTESGYADGRHPSCVQFAQAQADVTRRDFTINGMFYDPLTEQLHDWVGGVADLSARQIRTIGDPEARFGEDRLRMLRAVRFAAQLEFRIEEQTLAALTTAAAKIVSVSMERIRSELERLLRAPGAAEGLRLMILSGLGQALAGKLAGESSGPRRPAPGMRSFDQGCTLLIPWLENRATARQGFPAAEWWLLLAGLLGLDADQEPAPELPRQLQALSQGLRFSRQETRQLTEMALALVALPTLKGRLADQLRLLRHPGQALLAELLPVLRPVAASRLLGWFRELRQQHGWNLHPAPLLDGHQLRELGIPDGPELGHWILTLESEQLEGRILSEDQARSWLQAQLAIERESTALAKRRSNR
jgi:poly(A) polymerase